ncbi:membrane associated rhomboid family serine protease [Lewinella marina]|uniref:Rhomboid family intramembrane serine protease n=1 Tax=Neolewinella marina TaxID=438751 RepID=A0A2G0CE97_9BACT|nr:rhomboid family intramembrane serine protease [Neolewinella marina]NJB87396.1 membrane associated rhomboid family serine protease [Neolewinella marina]PHK98292.1 rhomboid family intramembrane serine protease [Neolewinella marina]
MLSKRNLGNVIRWPLGLLAVMYLVFIIDYYLTGGLLSAYYGLHTRELAGLPGIITAPFLHGGWGHLLSNTIPFVSLTGLLVFFYPRLWPRVLASLWLGTGVLVWVLGRHVTHIGASGVVYALAAFLAFSGIFRRDFRAIVVSLLVLFYYGGMIVGILPGEEGVSWESHLLGLVMGVLGAYAYRGEREEHEVIAQRKKEEKERQKRRKEPFLNTDAFDKTKEERQNEAFWQKLKELSERERLQR